MIISMFDNRLIVGNETAGREDQVLQRGVRRGVPRGPGPEHHHGQHQSRAG